METFFRVFTPSRPQPPEKPYSYFAAPDGQDVPQKMRYMINNTGKLGFALSVVDVMCCSHPPTYMGMARRFAYITCPLIGAGAVFTWTSNFLGKLREDHTTVKECKRQCLDDKATASAWNWALGAATASLVGFVWTRNVTPIVLTAVSAGFAASGFRYADMMGFNILLPKFVIHSSGNPNNWDFTLTAERKRNWTTVAPEPDNEVVEVIQAAEKKK